ncbi:20429_t:CDS:1, partial [Dentiscutata erythropus]
GSTIGHMGDEIVGCVHSIEIVVNGVSVAQNFYVTRIDLQSIAWNAV